MLCVARRFVKRQYDSRLFWVADCIDCGKPLIIYRSHKANLSKREAKQALEIAKKLFGKSAKLKGTMKLVPDHWNDHII